MPKRVPSAVGVLQEHIGWRNDSRKMLLFSTDASFHSAGDGKVGVASGRCCMAWRFSFPFSFAYLAAPVAFSSLPDAAIVESRTAPGMQPVASPARAFAVSFAEIGDPSDRFANRHLHRLASPCAVLSN